MLTTKAMALVAGFILCAAAPVAYYYSPVLLAETETTNTRIVAAVSKELLVDASVCWGAKQVSNVARYEAGQDNHLIFTRRKIEGFTGALLSRRDKDTQALQVLFNSGAVGNNPKVERRRVSPAEEMETIYLTPTKREYWKKGKGLCLAMPRVIELVDYTKPAPDSQGVQMIVATFDWDYGVEIAEWADPQTVEELKRRQRATARLKVHNKGYTVVGIDR
ncbi:MAG: hypothetical protein J0I57_14145 [Hyphomicrobium sp.]|nr:hypothetical protein [Hyphomicrobium sp.]